MCVCIPIYMYKCYAHERRWAYVLCITVWRIVSAAVLMLLHRRRGDETAAGVEECSRILL